MWTTADGCVLKVPGFRLRKWIEAQRRGCGASCGCRGCAESEGEIVAELGRIIQGARRTGTAKGRRSGRRMPVFSVSRGRRRYRIFTRPIAGGHHTVVAMTPDPVVVTSPAASPEEPTYAPIEEPAPFEEPLAGDDSGPEEGEWSEAYTRLKRPPYDVTKDVLKKKYRLRPRSGAAKVTWSGPHLFNAVEAAMQKGSAYVYILALQDQKTKAYAPFYVGQATGATPYARLRSHLNQFNQADFFLSKLCNTTLANQVQVWLGKVPGGTADTVEDAIAGLLQRSGITLRQTQLVEVPFKASGPVTIEEVLPKNLGVAISKHIPGYDATTRVLNIGKDQWFEL